MRVLERHVEGRHRLRVEPPGRRASPWCSWKTRTARQATGRTGCPRPMPRRDRRRPRAACAARPRRDARRRVRRRRRARRASHPWLRRPAAPPARPSSRRTRDAAAESTAATGSRRRGGGQRGGQIRHRDAATSSGCPPLGARSGLTATSRPRRISAAVRRTSKTASGCRRSAVGLRATTSRSAVSAASWYAWGSSPCARAEASTASASSVCFDGASPTPGQGRARLGVKGPNRGPDAGVADLPVQRVGGQQRLELGRRPGPRRHPTGPMSVSITSPASAGTSFPACFPQPGASLPSVSASGGPDKLGFTVHAFTGSHTGSWSSRVLQPRRTEPVNQRTREPVNL